MHTTHKRDLEIGVAMAVLLAVLLGLVCWAAWGDGDSSDAAMPAPMPTATTPHNDPGASAPAVPRGDPTPGSVDETPQNPQPPTTPWGSTVNLINAKVSVTGDGITDPNALNTPTTDTVFGPSVSIQVKGLTADAVVPQLLDAVVYVDGNSYKGTVQPLATGKDGATGMPAGTAYITFSGMPPAVLLDGVSAWQMNTFWDGEPAPIMFVSAGR